VGDELATRNEEFLIVRASLRGRRYRISDPARSNQRIEPRLLRPLDEHDLGIVDFDPDRAVAQRADFFRDNRQPGRLSAKQRQAVSGNVTSIGETIFQQPVPWRCESQSLRRAAPSC